VSGHDFSRAEKIDQNGGFSRWEIAGPESMNGLSQVRNG
jgi:hypothetical protein